MNGFSFLKRLMTTASRQRLDALKAAGVVLDLQTTGPPVGQPIILINLGSGPELWVLSDPDFTASRDPTRIINAQLLVYAGSPQEAVRRAAELSIVFERRWIRF